MQADDFFCAYQVLTENYNPATHPVLGPSVVCLAFAVELYIKELYHTLKIGPPRGHDGHNILTLFKGLPEKIQHEIFSHGIISSQHPWVVVGNIFSPKRFTSEYGISDAFMDEIAAISSGFTDWRYSYEGKRASHQYNSEFAESFIKALKSVSNKMRVYPVHESSGCK